MNNSSAPSMRNPTAVLLMMALVTAGSSAHADAGERAPDQVAVDQVPELSQRPRQDHLALLKNQSLLPRAPRVDLSILEGQDEDDNARMIQSLATNTDPNSAIYMGLNTSFENTISAEGEQSWYYVYSPNAGKLTFNLQAVNNANVDYDLHVFNLNLSTGMLEDEQVSAFGPLVNEQLSTLVSADSYYFICVNSYQGFDTTRPYKLTALYSSTSDAAEADDHPSQAEEYSGNFVVDQTLDNAYDADWMKFTVSQANKFTFSFNNVPSSSAYQVGIYDGNLNRLATISKNSTVTYSLGAGVYYLRVASLDSVVPTATYHLGVNVAATSVTLFQVDTDGGNGGFLNYGSGNFWRVYRYATVRGSMKDTNGNPVPNAPVSVVINTPQTYIPRTQAVGVTDASGNFSISMSLPAAAGRYAYNNWVSIHYYDMASMSISSSIVQSNTSLYHFAYSVYNPH